MTISQWTGGFTANVNLTNTSSSNWSSWSVGFSLPQGAAITNAWSATVTASGSSVTATNASYNGTLSAGQSTTFGFQGTDSGTISAPTSFTVNGQPCGSVSNNSGSTTPTTTATNVTSAPATTTSSASTTTVTQTPISTNAAANIAVNSGTKYQTINGFGFSEAFGATEQISGLSSTNQQAVLNLLFSTTSGAGMDIVRFGIGGAGSATNSTTGQVWLGLKAKSYGVNTFYADSWSAPANMKTNNSINGGGDLCGAPGAASCSNGDQRAAYASYLAGQASDFAQAGLPLKYIDFVNEPDYTPSYPGMEMTASQMANFIPYLGKALASAGLSTQVACCDAEGWQDEVNWAPTILASSGANYLGLMTGHGYASQPVDPVSSGGRPVWETEWSTFQSWDAAWNDGSSASGLAWANNIETAIVNANVNGFLYWWGATGQNGDNESLIDITNGSYQPSGRLWAFANFSRFIRPGAVRIGDSLTGQSQNLLSSAYTSPSGGQTIVVVINNGGNSTTVGINLGGSSSATTAVPYTTDSNENVAQQPTISVSGGSFVASIPADSITTYVIG
jgi:O-glycosyl hydrolase